MGNPRIIKLDMPLTVTSSTFGEAFGEYSELKGRGRKRRHSRKQERRMTRIADRATRKRAKQDMRAEQQEARQTRKDVRKTRKVARGEMGNEEEGAESTENGGAEPTGDAEQGQPTQGEGAGEGEYETTQESDYQDPEEQNASEDEESGADGYYDSFDGTSGEGIEYDNLGSTDDIYALQDDDFYSYLDENSSADGTPTRVRKRINPKVKEIAVKSEWNKEMVSRQQAMVDAIDRELSNPNTSPARSKMLGIRRSQIVNQITLHKDRAVSFDGMLNDYCNCDGYSDASGKRPKKTESKRRKAETKAAKREAHKQRAKVRKANKVQKKMNRKGVNPNDVTPVDEQLNPEFGENYIVIPEKEIGGQSSAEGTGLIALDDINDFDAPRENEFEVTSGFDGMKKVNWKGVLIGVAIAGLAIYGAKKAKLF
jgi:hypothetical protein